MSSPRRLCFDALKFEVYYSPAPPNPWLYLVLNPLLLGFLFCCSFYQKGNVAAFCRQFIHFLHSLIGRQLRTCKRFFSSSCIQTDHGKHKLVSNFSLVGVSAIFQSFVSSWYLLTPFRSMLQWHCNIFWGLELKQHYISFWYGLEVMDFALFFSIWILHICCKVIWIWIFRTSFSFLLMLISFFEFYFLEALDLQLPNTLYQSLQVKVTSFHFMLLCFLLFGLSTCVICCAVSVGGYWQWTENHHYCYPQYVGLIGIFLLWKFHQPLSLPQPRTSFQELITLVAFQRACSFSQCSWHDDIWLLWDVCLDLWGIVQVHPWKVILIVYLGEFLKIAIARDMPD